MNQKRWLPHALDGCPSMKDRSRPASGPSRKQEFDSSAFVLFVLIMLQKNDLVAHSMKN
jgi:hypothetical protein